MIPLLALVSVFSAAFQPIVGGELVWSNDNPNVTIMLTVNGDADCTVPLTSQESQSLADLVVDVVESDHPGKLLSLSGGGTIAVRNLGDGDVRVRTNDLDRCRVVLLGSEGEPEKVSALFGAAAAA